MVAYSLDNALDWVDELSENDYVVFDHFLSQDHYDGIMAYFLSKLGDQAFDKAGIGTLGNHTIDKDVRGDYVYWIVRAEDDSVMNYFNRIDEMIALLKRYCFLPISGSEFHFAHYPRGSFYEKHIDQFKGRGNRLMSVVFYMNEDWQTSDAGELNLYLKDGRCEVVTPIANRLVLFKSDQVPHEVLPTYVSRYSLTGWLLNQPDGLGFLLA